MTLSENRAKAVTDYLEYKGIPKDRMVPVGHGETKIANGCECEDGVGPGVNCTEEQHQQNRRTTFKIIRTDYQYGGEQMKQMENTRIKRGPPPGAEKKPVNKEEEEEEETGEEE